MSFPRFEGKPFSELLSNIVDNRGKTCPTAPSGIALIATNCITNDNLFPVHENVRYVSDDDYKHWFRGHPVPGDLILVTKGTPGRVCLVPPIVDFCIAQDMVAVRADSQKVDPMYLFAALRSTDAQAEIENLHVGSLIPHFKKGDFNKLIIPLPERNLQEYIGEQYFTLSAKIDLLHRQNKTLEGMAEALWRKMFVEEADPGWKKGRLGELASVTTGKGLKRSEYSDNGLFPVLGANGKIGRTDMYLSDEKLILTGRVGTLGEVFISNEKVWISDNVLIVKPNDRQFFYPLYFLLKNTDFENLNVGSTQPLVTQTDLKNIEIRLPNNGALDFITTWCESAFEKTDRNLIQIRTLSRLRDNLLPKLMSGEVRVQI